VAPCRYVDSTQFAKPREWPTTDGQHLTMAGYRGWADGIAKAVIRLKTENALK
jgi:lysophospholipase L1-like esterase